MASCGGTVLKMGMRSPCVAYLNGLLITRGALAERDVADKSYFSPVTSVAVRDFQGQNGLTVDAIVGPETWKALGEAVSETNVFNEVNPKGVNVGTNPAAIRPAGPGQTVVAGPGLIERLKTGFAAMPTWQKWGVVAGAIVATLGVAYVASTNKPVSGLGFIDFLNGDEPKRKPRAKRCGRTPDEGTLEDAEDVLPEA
jgi:peptidoglycan hydrolase-like protein with peptidoglycan-binding domain